MQMRHTLTPLLAAVDDHAIALRQAQLAGDFSRHQELMPDERLMFVGELVERGDFFARNDEHVRWRLRVHVAKGEAEVVLIDDVGFDLAVDDAFEDRHLSLVTGHWSFGFGHSVFPHC